MQSFSHLNMAIPLLLDSVERSYLIFTGVPIYMQILLMIRAIEVLVHPFDNLLIGAALERHRFTFIIEA